LQVRERRQEIGLLHAVGWRAGKIRRLFVQEGFTLALVGTLPGVGLAIWALLGWHLAQSVVSPVWLAVGVVVLLGLVTMLAAWPALRAIQRMQVVEVLRAE